MGKIYLGDSELTPQQEVNTISGNVETVSGDVITLSGSVTANTNDISTVSGNVTTLSSTTTAHTSDTSAHVTASDKTNWNGKLDATAYTPTDLSNYYTKSETSGNTEISTALSGKSDTGHTHSQYLTSITSSQITTALGFTPADNASLTAHTADSTVHVTQALLDRITELENLLTINSTYNITDISDSTRILSSTTSIYSVEIDGVVQPSVVSAYTFSTTGEHTVKYKLKSSSIGDATFNKCGGMTTCTINGGITNIGNNAFGNCSGLTSMVIPDSVISIGQQAFSSCKGLTSVTMPNSVTSIGMMAFYNCSGLTSIKIPGNVKVISNNAFEYCTSLTSCTINIGVTSIGYGAFRYCSGLTSINIPYTVAYIGNEAFRGCQNISGGLALPFNQLSSSLIISPSAFTECYNITSVTISNGIKSINSATFRSCRSITSIDIPDSVTSIGENAFTQCMSLTSITIGNGVTNIGASAFSNCSSATSITIGTSITNIGDKAFKYCSFNSITIKAITPPVLSSADVFSMAYDYTIYVPSGSVNTYKAASGWSAYASKIQAIP